MLSVLGVMIRKTVPAFEVIGFSIMNMSFQFCEMLYFLQLTCKGLEQISRGRGCGGHCTSLVIFLWFETFQNKMLGEVTPRNPSHSQLAGEWLSALGCWLQAWAGDWGEGPASDQCAGQGTGVTSECPQR